jgi:hypothetical protein
LRILQVSQRSSGGYLLATDEEGAQLKQDLLGLTVTVLLAMAFCLYLWAANR